MSQTKHVIKHRVVPQSPKQQYNLPPADQSSRPPPAKYQHHHQQQQRPRVLAPPPPPQIMAQQPPAITHAPSTPQVVHVSQNPNPTITYLGSRPPEKRERMFNKEEFGEMMMMQYVQTQQMVMQKLMMRQLSEGNYQPHDGYFHGPYHGHGRCCTSHGSCHGGCHSGCHGDCHH